jgi:hypothetical protein
LRNNFGPPGIAHDSLRSYRGLTLREVDRDLQLLRSGDTLTAFGGGLRFAGFIVEGYIAIERSLQAEPASVTGRIESDAEQEREGGAS